MPINQRLECTGSGQRGRITITDVEELLVLARAQGATGEYEIGVDVALEFRSPARITRMVVEPPKD